ncbi:PHP domain protein [Clostridium bornimense]|uniref:PHP domain protein n=1 Tax=Clostridium bornimense TaxID=1216932 RepID=W6S1C2_9CLOT|nr:PHP-associated domain-containing protein [Clostridium bornimense]CDM69674.1 PHP domain protein [Clostridium bornimense]
MNIDFHVHGLLSKKKDFNEKFFLEEINSAKSNNIEGIILCEHFQAIAFNDIYKYLEVNYPYKNGRYLVNGISIFPAMEVSIKDGGHIILSGGMDDIIDIHEILMNNIEKENFIEFEDLLNLGDRYNCLKIGAHPFRKGQKLSKKPYELLGRLDCFELNAKDIYKKGEIEVKEKVISLGEKVDKPIVGGSDSHTALQIGAIKTKIDRQCCNVIDIKESIKINCDVEVSPSLEFKVFTSKILKRYLSATAKNYNRETSFKI